MTFKELLRQYNIPAAPEGHHHSREGWVQFDCPYCGKDSNKWHMGFSLEGRFMNCWVCGSHSLFETLLKLKIPYGIVEEFIKEKTTYRPKKKIITGKLTIPKQVGELLPAHIKYLKGRNFNPRLLRDIWGIQGIGIVPNLSWRIFIPIFQENEVVSWTTRSISSSKKVTRYITASPEEESVHHKLLLYGERYAQHCIVIVEGPFNVWRIGPGCVATFGLNYSQAQVNRMLQYPKRVVCFDNEPEAQKKAKELCDNLSVFPGETYNIVLDAKDAAEESDKNIQIIRKEFLDG